MHKKRIFFVKKNTFSKKMASNHQLITSKTTNIHSFQIFLRMKV